MRFDSFTSSGDMAVDKLNIFISGDIENTIFYEKLTQCDFRVLLVTLDAPDTRRLSTSDYDPDRIKTLFNAWRFLTQNSFNIVNQKKAWDIIDEIGGVLESDGKIKSHPGLRRFRGNSSHDHYFLLLNGHEPQGIPVFEIASLCNIWKLVNGYLPLHASGVIHKGQLFIFTGPSGAGKSTVTKLSQEIGDKPLDEDQLLIYKSSEKNYYANAWGYNLSSCNVSIRAIFTLIQNTEDQILPLKPLNLARQLFGRHNDLMGNQFSDDLLKCSFEFVAGIARQVPGYELRFRKSPDFWKLIDEQFPD